MYPGGDPVVDIRDPDPEWIMGVDDQISEIVEDESEVVVS